MFNEGRLIAAGYNRRYHTSHCTHTSDCAEVLALKKAPRGLRRDSTIIVARKNKGGSYGMAKPCSRCQKMLEKAGVRTVFFTTPSGWEKISLRS